MARGEAKDVLATAQAIIASGHIVPTTENNIRDIVKMAVKVVVEVRRQV